MPRLSKQARRELVHERRTQILSAAARVFAEKGFERATIRSIARAAGVSEGSIYIYFKNKQDLLIHLPRQFIQAPFDALQAAQANGAAPPPEILLNFVARNVIEVATQNRALLRVLFSSLPTMDAGMRAEYWGDTPALVLGALEGYLREQQAAGVFRADLDPAVAARILPGVMLFFVLIQEILLPAETPRLPYDRIVPQVIQTFLHGVLAHPETQTPPEGTSPPTTAPDGRATYSQR